ncbi:hypothetical protein DID88_008809 [Monilinia fructigena]|uniref:Ribosomal protein L34 n=1 Tax=Monilinia fructigena TaxID=38457 RepID=A0A395J6Y3_9HELO|nr:hypothetical protein DID88_008809 [Monilinia fructigena]
MLCLRCSHSLRATPIVSRVLFQSSSLLAKRTFTSITPLRPTLSPSAFKPTSSVVVSSEAAPLDLLPKISTHPALSTTQVRCGPRNTFSPSHFVRKRRHGFLSRIRTRKGRATLQRRKSKKRSTLSH